MSNAIAAKGALLKRSTDAGVTYVTIAEVTGINLNFDGDDVDTTSHDTAGNFREHLITLLNVGIDFDINFIPTNNQHSGTNGMLADLKNRTKRYYQLVYPDGGGTVAITLLAFVKSVNIGLPVDDKLSASITLVSDGAPTGIN
jgi:predicted secreted protein